MVDISIVNGIINQLFYNGFLMGYNDYYVYGYNML